MTARLDVPPGDVPPEDAPPRDAPPPGAPPHGAPSGSAPPRDAFPHDAPPPDAPPHDRPHPGAPPHAAVRQEELPPPRPVFSGQTWREIAYLLTSLPMAVIAFCYVATWLYVGAVMAVTVIGLPLLALGLVGCRQLGKVERARARALLRVHVEQPTPIRHRTHGGFFPWLWATLKDPVGWRHALYATVRLPWGVTTFVVTFVSLFVAWPLLPWLARWMTHVDRAMVRGLLAPSDELERRIAQLEAGRAVVTDTASADLRRIERDLHDGAQARLVALAMDLGLAREKLTEDPETAARMVDEAHGEVKLALQELRDLARGIHPAILTDRGLGPTLATLTNRCTIPVTLTTDLPQRPAPAIEAIAYFTVSELLQNISKHSNAHHATIDIWRTTDRLLLHVTDNGQGGATPHPGTGLAGLTERLTSVDGQLLIHSPTGGPTTITAELPWRDADAGRPGHRKG
ncbi:sensor domain-containing protein [Streptomyces sp. TRM 70351]|uniref:sensor histidine kinase n=1 Tax=Streptomyces sp. TRM 70351 TaxID=3116552 RepID=UPI002E7BE1F8|nr:sensor domain-containing protein [Streptomyces sp. TRM 70351]MEE1930961.1 sensor domain-containing protein [Streptomyces sp. TRM 70351]